MTITVNIKNIASMPHLYGLLAKSIYPTHQKKVCTRDECYRIFTDLSWIDDEEVHIEIENSLMIIIDKDDDIPKKLKLFMHEVGLYWRKKGTKTVAFHMTDTGYQEEKWID